MTNFKKQTVRNNQVSEQWGSKLEFVTIRVNVLLQFNAFVTFDFEIFRSTISSLSSTFGNHFSIV